MSCPAILIPFGLPPAEHAQDLVKQLAAECSANGLAMLISRYRSLVRQQFDDFSPQLPHEAWLTTHFNHSGVRYYANALNITLPPGHWFLLQPVHLHIARNHLVLTDYRQLTLSESEASSLFEKAQTLCQQAGLECVWGSPNIWFLRADHWAELVTSSPDTACGHNIEIWSPRGKDALAWRKLQNDIQMEWFIDPINPQREARGEAVINGLWLWAGTNLATTVDSIVSFPNAEQFFHTPPALSVIDQLSSAALSSDWATWIRLMIELEHTWFQPLCAALKQRKLNSVQLHFSNSNTLLSVQTSHSALLKFWRLPNLKNLLT